MVTLNETVGIVAVANDKGLKLDGADAWLNWSRYADARCRPDKGQRVRCMVDSQGFLRSVEPVHTEPATAVTAEPAHDLTRDRVITRQWAINAATAILASGTRAVEPAAAVKLAAQLEAWALRPVAVVVTE